MRVAPVIIVIPQISHCTDEMGKQIYIGIV